MEVWTLGRRHYPGFLLTLSTMPEEALKQDEEENRGYRIVLIQEGIGIVQVGDYLYQIVAPAVYCLNENESLVLVAGNQVKAKALRFLPTVVNARILSVPESTEGASLFQSDFQDRWYFDPFVERQENYYGCIPVDPAVAIHIAQMVDEIDENLSLQPDQHWPCRSRSFLLELLFLIRRIHLSADTTPNKLPNTSEISQIKPIIEYLHTHYREKIKLETLTSLFHINNTTMNKHFRKATGLSIISYLNTIRMQMASSMLRNTLLPTTEIMSKVGIVDDAHFIRNFRKYAGCTPAEFRNQHCWMMKG
ncbi:Bifunctional transcriptional activator/DNA repair enzyme AdaA [compost metagenome]